MATAKDKNAKAAKEPTPTKKAAAKKPAPKKPVKKAATTKPAAVKAAVAEVELAPLPTQPLIKTDDEVLARVEVCLAHEQWSGIHDPAAYEINLAKKTGKVTSGTHRALGVAERVLPQLAAQAKKAALKAEADAPGNELIAKRGAEFVDRAKRCIGAKSSWEYLAKGRHGLKPPAFKMRQIEMAAAGRLSADNVFDVEEALDKLEPLIAKMQEGVVLRGPSKRQRLLGAGPFPGIKTNGRQRVIPAS